MWIYSCRLTHSLGTKLMAGTANLKLECWRGTPSPVDDFDVSSSLSVPHLKKFQVQTCFGIIPLDQRLCVLRLWPAMSEFAFPFPVLVCDTGGTNVRFALVSQPGAGLGDIVHLHTGDYPGLPEAIEAANPKLGTRPRSMIACGAGPVVGRTLKLTNAPWVMDGPRGGAPNRPRPGAAAQRLRGAGAVACRPFRRPGNGASAR